ncbi:MAG: Phospho-N-acetylmuramoyl-pentapeptide-transferase [Candidatus Nomurabacteria bacterium GW2011_GWA2_40_9]|uniref:Phospho-N-acetylmuramoyl-pentapeptide-transferase n=1 Tax=Candidatus Nomurabacteria bacterium GW2011_GWA2_40_9 TaxID=1618734 RepID=A0A0G0W5E1_9BACT|nr:MAG: Phospho-N-acetylmuramoyl-pentapeptide-transferase [Candidatus Nomurabacteria bacterium GW2011_GWA2_40_9]
MNYMLLDLFKIFVPTTLAFFLGIFFTPFATHFFYKYKMWKKKPRNEINTSPEFKSIHSQKEKNEISVPCVGGIIIWVSVLLTIFLIYILSILFPESIFVKLNFFSRSQTLIPIAIFILGSFFGLIDDILEINGKSHITRHSVWYTRSKIFTIIILGLLSGLWFYYKLGMSGVHIPFDGTLYLGILFIPFVIFIMFATFSSGVIDGIDGLSGGVLASIFTAYSVIAFTNNQIDLATLCGAITGAILAFLWFNIPPARFYMGETGMMPLTITLATVAFLTDSVLLLPVIAFVLTATSFSSSAQILSKKLFGKRIFKVAPLHHHFEAIGWPSYKVTMRFWVLSIVFAIIGVILFVIS